MTKMTFEIPDDKHAEFKAAAARRRETLQQVLNDCVDRYLRSQEAKSGPSSNEPPSVSPS